MLSLAANCFVSSSTKIDTNVLLSCPLPVYPAILPLALISDIDKSVGILIFTFVKVFKSNVRLAISSSFILSKGMYTTPFPFNSTTVVNT